MSQPAVAVRQNRAIVVRRTGTPSSRAAVRAPPLAKTELPNLVRHSAQLASPVAVAHHSTDTWKRPPAISADDPNSAAADPQPGVSSRPVTWVEPVTAS